LHMKFLNSGRKLDWNARMFKSSISSGGNQATVPDRGDTVETNNLVEMLYHTVSRFPDKDAIMWKVDGAYQSISYQEFWNRIRHTAAGLALLGVRDNDKVAILSDSNPMWGITDFAVASIGAVSVPV